MPMAVNKKMIKWTFASFFENRENLSTWTKKKYILPITDSTIHDITVVTWKGRILLNGKVSFNKSGKMYCKEANKPNVTPKRRAKSAVIKNTIATLFFIFIL